MTRSAFRHYHRIVTGVASGSAWRSLTCSRWAASGPHDPAAPPGARLQAAARQHGNAAADRTPRDHPPPAPVPGRLARDAAGAGSCAARSSTELEAAADAGSWRDVRAASRAGYDTRSRASEARRHERLLLPRRAPRGAARPLDLRLHAAEGAHLRERAGHVRSSSSARCGARATARSARPRPGRSCAGTRTSSARREEAGPQAARRRRLPAGLTTHAGRERDAPRLVHAATCGARSRSARRSPSSAGTGISARRVHAHVALVRK